MVDMMGKREDWERCAQCGALWLSPMFRVLRSPVSSGQMIVHLVGHHHQGVDQLLALEDADAALQEAGFEHVYLCLDCWEAWFNKMVGVVQAEMKRHRLVQELLKKEGLW